MIRNIYALLVGIDNYPNPDAQLSGCVNDIKTVEKFLQECLDREKYELHSPQLLLDKEATRDNVIKKFEQYLCKAGKEDVVLFYFCGHGSQELAGSEFSALEYEKEIGIKKLETIVCYDSRTLREDGTEIRDIADKELRYLIAKVAENEPHILVVFDCCHSSSGTRDTDRKERVRRLPTDIRSPRAYNEFCFADDHEIAQNLKQGKFPEGKHIFMSACLHTETAKEMTASDGNSRGVFSYFLLKELNSLNAALSYNDLLNEVKGYVHGSRRDQTPQIEPIGISSQDLNSIAFLGDREVIKPRSPYFNLIYRHKIQDRQSAEWIVTGGASQFLEEGCELAVYPENSTVDERKDESKKLGEVRIVAARMEESVVRFISKSEPPTDFSYKAVLTKRSLPNVRFYLEGDGAALAQVEQKLANSAVVGIERDRNKPHQYRLYAREQRFEITDANDRLLVVPIEGNGEYDVNKAVKQVEHIARWTKTRQLENPNSSIPKDAIEIEITHNDKVYTNSDLQIEQGSKIRLKLKNTRNQPLYCAILDVAGNYEVSLLKFFPEGSDGTWICLNPGQTYQAQARSGADFIEEIPFGMPDEVINQGLTEYQEILKLIVSTEAFTTLSQFEQNSLLRADQQSRQPLTAPPVTDWMTKQITLTTVRADSVELTPQTEKAVSAGVQVIAPPGLQATARLKTPSSTTRSLSTIGLPALLDNTQVFQFSTSRSVGQKASVLELEVNPSTIDAVKPDSPMIISVDRPLQPNERVLAVARDGQFYFPLGVGQAKNGKTEIKIERLCDPQRLNTDEREIRQAIQLCFRKVVLENLGQESSYAWLRKAILNRDGTVSYSQKGDVDTVQAAVAKADNILLYIHGIIGDTESMIPSVRYAKVNANGQAKSLEELYDLVLAFDYESLNTSIEHSARELKRQLAAVGLEANHGKTLHILAHSMGGLVSRSFIEQGNGNEVVSHLIMVGTPNGGSPWATVHDLATTLLSFGLNLSSVPIVPSLLEKLVETMSVTLREMHATKSSFLDELKAFADPRCPYSIIAGSTALMDRTSEVKQLLDALKQKMRRAIELPFGDEENDIAVAVRSIIDVPQNGSSTVNILDTIACDHLSYFRQAEGLCAIASAIGRAFDEPPDSLPPTRPFAPQGPQPNPVSPLPSSDTGTQSIRSTKGIPAEPTSNPNNSGDGNGSVNASVSASPNAAVDTNESVVLQPQPEAVIASGPQEVIPKSSLETRTTTWFPKSHIIAIGIDKYKSGIECLDNAVSDAKKIAEIFETQGFEKHLLLGEKDKRPLVNRDEVGKLLTNLKNTLGENDRLIFYYAGHGIALPSQDSSKPEPNSQNSTNGKPETKPRNKPQGYLILQEAEQNKPETYLPMSDLIEWLSAISCRHYLMILDCCYAGAIQWSFGRTRQVLLQKVFPSLLDTFIDSPAWQILTSSDEDQPANDGLLLDLSLQKNNRVRQDKTSNSPFVCFLEQALVEGQADVYKSGIVTATELNSYLRRMVEQSTSKAEKRQTPRLFTLPEKHKRGEFVFLLGKGKDLETVKQNLPPDPKISDEDNPYRGLESYTDNDGDLFFGRKKLIEDLSEYVQTHLFTVVLGTSGVGKSSLVNAGLVPKFKETFIEAEPSQSSNSEEKTTQQSDSEPKVPQVKWDNYEIFRPGQSPATTLEEKLKKLESSNIPDNTKRLLVIDQFEEIETQCRDEAQKTKFWNQLISQLKNASDTLRIVVTVRSDFESTLRSKFEDAINKFNSENNKSKSKGRGKSESKVPKSTNEQSRFAIDWVSARFIVPAMEREELQDAIEKPAEKMAVFFTLDPQTKGDTEHTERTERTLVQQLVHEVAGMPGALPLLSFALYTMYRNFAQRYVNAEKTGDLIKREINWDDYKSLDGGVPKSLTNRATEEYNNLAFKLDENNKVVKDQQGNPIQEEEQSIAQARQEMLRWVMLRMVTLDGGQVARRRVLQSELVYADPGKNEYLDQVIERFKNARLLVSDEKYVEPAHDALIINWELLRKWIKEEEESLTLRDRISPDVRDWQKLKSAEEPSKLGERILNALENGVNWTVKKFTVEGELKRLNKQKNTASKNSPASNENTNMLVQETTEPASEDVPANQIIAKEVSSPLPKNSYSYQNTIIYVSDCYISEAVWNTPETAKPDLDNLPSKGEITEQENSQNDSDNKPKQTEKSSDRLWDKDSRLDELGLQLAKLQTSKETWLNKTEANFVLQSLIKKYKEKFGWNAVWGIIGAVLLGLTALALNEQRNVLIEQVRTSRQSAETNLQANRDLEALTDILQARKTFDNLLLSIFPTEQEVNIGILHIGNSEAERTQVRGTLFKAVYTTKERDRFQLDRGVIKSVAFHPEKDLLAIAGNYGTIWLYNSAGQPKKSFPANQNVSTLAFTPDGKWLVTGGDNNIKFWQIVEENGKIDLSKLGEIKYELKTENQEKINVIDIAFLPNEKQNDQIQVVIVSRDRDYKVYKSDFTIPKTNEPPPSVKVLKQLELKRTNEKVYDVAFSRTRKDRLVTVGKSNQVTLWKISEKNLEEINTVNTGQENVYSVAFTKNGKLATVGEDNTVKTVKFWEIKEKNKIEKIEEFIPFLKSEQKSFKKIPEIPENIYGMAFGANGKLAIFGEDDAVTLLDDSGKTIRTIQPQDTYVNNAIAGNMAYSPDEKQVAVIAGGNTIRLWDIKSGKQKRRLSIQTEKYGDAISLAFSPNSKEFAVGTKKGYITLWNIYGQSLDSVRPQWRINEGVPGKDSSVKTSSKTTNNQTIQRIIFSHDGTQLAVFIASGDLGYLSFEKQNTSRFKRIEDNNQSQPEFNEEKIDLGNIKDLVFDSKFEQFLTIDEQNSNVKLQNSNVKFWKNKQTPQQVETKANSVAFSPNNQFFATAGDNGDVKVWNVKDLKKPFLEFPTHQKNIKSIVFNPLNSNFLLTGGEDGTVRSWNISGNQPTQLAVDKSKIELVAFSSNNKLLATIDKERKLLMWAQDDGHRFHLKDISQTELGKFQETPKVEFAFVAFRPNSKHLITVGKDFIIRLWNIEGNYLGQLDENQTKQQKVNWVTWSGDGKVLATVQSKKVNKITRETVKMWDFKDFKDKHSIPQKPLKNQSLEMFQPNKPKESNITSIALSSDGKLATTLFSPPGRVKLWWNPEGRDEKIQEFQTQQGIINSIAFSRDEKRLATVGVDQEKRTLMVWDVDSRNRLALIQEDNIDRVEFSLDGRLLAGVRNGDNQFMMWDISGDKFNPIYGQKLGQELPVRTFEFNDDLLTTVGKDGSVRFWQINENKLLVQACNEVRKYLENNPNVAETDIDLCKNIPIPLKQNLVNQNTSTGNKELNSANQSISVGNTILVTALNNPDKLTGVEAFARGDFNEAYNHFKASLESKPNDPEARIYLNNARIATKNSYTIAVPVPITNNLNGALEILRGVAQAQEEINQAGGINGVPLKLLIADDKNDPEVAEPVAKELVKNPDVLGVVGHFASSVTRKASKIYDNNLVSISPVSTSAWLSGNSDYTFRTVPSDKLAAKKLADYMLDQLNKKKAVVFYNSKSEYSCSLTLAFITALTGGRGKQSNQRCSKYDPTLPTIFQGRGEILEEFDLSDPNFDAAKSLEDSINKGAQVVVLLSDTGELNKTLEVVKANHKRLPLLGGDDLYHIQTLQEGQNLAEGMVLGVSWGFDRPSSDFSKTSQNLWKATVNWRTAMAYDATQAFAEALRQNSKSSCITQTSQTKDVRNCIAKSLSSISVKNGASGTVEFDESGIDQSGDRKDPPIQLVKVKAKSNSRSGTGYDFELVK